MTGLLLAGIGVSLGILQRFGFFYSNSLKQHVTQPPDSQKNFFVVDAKTEVATIEQAFIKYTHDRKDIAILLINQHVRPDSIHALLVYS